MSTSINKYLLREILANRTFIFIFHFKDIFNFLNGFSYFLNSTSNIDFGWGILYIYLDSILFLNFLFFLN